jgi:hypothetical protein
MGLVVVVGGGKPMSDFLTESPSCSLEYFSQEARYTIILDSRFGIQRLARLETIGISGEDVGFEEE